MDPLLNREAPSFETNRLVVEEWHRASSRELLHDLIAVLLTPAVTASLPEAWQGTYDPARAAAWVRERDDEGTTLLARTRPGHECVGLALLHDSLSDNKRAELRIGYLIGESHWGRGYATELVGGVVDWARQGSYGSVIGGVDASNTASRRVLEKCGFRLTSDTAADHVFYELSF